MMIQNIQDAQVLQPDDIGLYMHTGGRRGAPCRGGLVAVHEELGLSLPLDEAYPVDDGDVVQRVREDGDPVFDGRRLLPARMELTLPSAVVSATFAA